MTKVTITAERLRRIMAEVLRPPTEADYNELLDAAEGLLRENETLKAQLAEAHKEVSSTKCCRVCGIRLNWEHDEEWCDITKEKAALMASPKETPMNFRLFPIVVGLLLLILLGAIGVVVFREAL